MICPDCLHENLPGTTTCQACGRPLDRTYEKAATEGEPGARRFLFEPGQMVAGRYQVVQALGRGSLAETYLVSDLDLGGRQLVLKAIHPALARRPEYLTRLTEVLLINRDLAHPGIAAVFDLQRDGDLAFVTTEYWAGQSLAGLMAERAAKRFTPTECLAVLSPVLAALAEAHHLRIHTDLKPENILVKGELTSPWIKLTDFGTADVLSGPLFLTTAQSLGAMAYLAPEQAAGRRDLGPATDLYAVGAVLYEMLTGRPPMGRFALPGEMDRRLPGALDRVIARALSPDPDGRFQSAAEFQAALAEAVRAPSVAQESSVTRPEVPAASEATATETGPRPGLWRRLIPQAVLVLVAVAALIAGLKLFGPGSGPGPDARVTGLLDQARTALKAGRVTAAKNFLSRVLELDRDNLAAKRLWFQAYDLGRRTRDQKGRIAKYLAQGRRAMARKHLELAEKIFKNLLVVDPGNQAARTELARLKKLQARVKSLVARAQKALVARRLKQAETFFEQAAKLDVDHPAIERGLAETARLKQSLVDDLQRAEEDLELRRLFAAWAGFKKVLHRYPGLARAKAGLARLKASLKPEDVFAALRHSPAAAKLVVTARPAAVSVRDREGNTPLIDVCAGLPVGSADRRVFRPEPPLAEAKWLLKKGARVIDADKRGRTALMAAAERGFLSLVKLLLGRGAKATRPDKDGATALHYAALSGDPALIGLLMAKGARADRADKQGRTPLHLAAAVGRVRAIKKLLAAGAKVGAATRRGLTPLHLAAGTGRREALDLLLAKGADPGARDVSGRTPLHLAAAGGHEAIIGRLLARKAQVDARDKLGITPLQLAAARGHLAAVRLLAAKGARLNAVNKRRESALHAAAGRGQTAVVEFLLQKGAKVNLQDAGGDTPLHRAAGKGRLEAARALIARGAKLNLASRRRLTPLHLAALGGHAALVKLLLDRGDEANSPGRPGVTPLHLAAGKGRLEAVRALIRGGARLNEPNAAGVTALHLAALGGHAPVVKLLLDKGAKINAADRRGLTPLHAAVIKGRVKVIRLLVARRANRKARDRDRETPLAVARRYCRRKIFDRKKCRAVLAALSRRR
jgi:ankyrin repeat protein/tetratricopeptide (TPR) repeat protein